MNNSTPQGGTPIFASNGPQSVTSIFNNHAKNTSDIETVDRISLYADFAAKKGPIKPIHGVGNGPLQGRFTINKIEDFKQMRIPYSRLHDTEGQMGSGEFVNIHCIFKDFDADVDDPTSYNFECTDKYIKGIIDAGTKVFYRLGETIENRCDIHRSHTFVPKDMQKWAQICEHIIRHYNEGWANGYHYNIEYWEIWNEPEGAPNISPNWSGTPEEYFELYRITSNHLKKCFPNLKIGGDASVGFYETGTNKTFALSFIEKFLSYITAPETKSPIDFFSWHFYNTSPERVKVEIEASEKMLAKFGLENIENIIDEWNYMECWAATEAYTRRTNKGAAFVSAMHTVMQKSSISKSMYYDAECNRLVFCGLYNPVVKSQREKPYYSFVCFGNLYALGTEVETSEDTVGIYSLAATNGKTHAMMITNYENSDTNCTVNFKNTKNTKNIEAYVIDENRMFEKIFSLTSNDGISSVNLTLKKNSIIYIELK